MDILSTIFSFVLYPIHTFCSTSNITLNIQHNYWTNSPFPSLHFHSSQAYSPDMTSLFPFLPFFPRNPINRTHYHSFSVYVHVANAHQRADYGPTKKGPVAVTTWSAGVYLNRPITLFGLSDVRYGNTIKF